MARPALVAHADWSTAPARRWLALALLHSDGHYRALAPEPVGPLDTLFARLMGRAGGGSVLLGVDFPIGLPRAYAARAGIEEFRSALPAFGRGAWADFYDPAAEPAEISLHRPFYPRRPGGTGQRHLCAGLGLDYQVLLRSCERATEHRPRACSLFWTLGGNQVGKAAIAGWRDLLTPALRRRPGVALWPFDGRLDDLVGAHRVVVAETYPAEFCRHLGVRFGAGRGKRTPAGRKGVAVALEAWSHAAGVDLDQDLRALIDGGFGERRDGEDRFDAVIGLLGMLNVVLGRRPAGDPEEPALRRIEGWILGQQVSPGGGDGCDAISPGVP